MEFPELEPGSSFEIDENGIGLLEIAGRVGEDTTRAALAMLEATDLRGVLVSIDTLGGDHTEATLILLHLLTVQQRVPVIGLVRKALSAGLLISCGCPTLYAESEDSLFGGVGSVWECCNGVEPVFLVSAATPRKLDGRELSYGPNNFFKYSQEDLEGQQKACDRAFETSLNLISQFRGVPEEVLREFCDGSVFRTRGARFYDLCHGIHNEAEVYKQLTERILR